MGFEVYINGEKNSVLLCDRMIATWIEDQHAFRRVVSFQLNSDHS